MTQLWPHQEKAVSFCEPLSGSGLLLSMGVGKSLCALELLKRWDVKWGLIACPLCVASVWPGEIKKHVPGQFTPIVVDGKTPSKKLEQCKYAQKLYRAGERVLLIINYESCWRDPIGKFLQTAGLEAIVCDESHRIQAAGSKVSRFFSQLGRTTKRKLILTGTPMSSGPLGIYGQARFVAPHVFGYSFVGFRSKYAVMRPLGNVQIVKGYQNLEDLHDKLYSFSYRTTTGEVLTLPDSIDESRTFNLCPKARRAYDELEADLMTELGDGQIVSTPNILSKMIRLHQLASGWVRPDDSDRSIQLDTGKAELLSDMLTDIDEPIVIFVKFTKDLETVKAVCEQKGFVTAEISGRLKELEKFQSGEAKAVVVQIQAGGLGISLVQARICFYYSMSYSLGEYEQSRARVLRPGQERSVVYYNLVCKDSIDEDIVRSLGAKGNLAEAVLDTMRRRRQG